MTDELITRARELAAKATPESGYGEGNTALVWEPSEDGDGADIWYADGDQCAHVYDNIGYGVFTANHYAALFAASRELVPELVDALERVTAELAHERENHLFACKLVGAMHEAAVGEMRGPIVGVVEDVQNLRAERDALRAENRWIPVGERLPEALTCVLIYDGICDGIHIGYRVPDIQQWTTLQALYFHGNTYSWITHWRPLAEPPEGGAK